MRFAREIVLLPLVCLILLQVITVDAIKCFQCTSADEGCADALNTNSSYYKECDTNKQYFCRKIIHTILDSNKLVRVNRGCGWELNKGRVDNCYQDDDDFKFEHVCQCFEDGCNGAVGLKYSTLLPGLVVGFVISKLLGSV